MKRRYKLSDLGVDIPLRGIVYTGFVGGYGMYKIGEFSKITNLTVKALRYYDEQKILQPSCRADNEYRLYDDKDFEKAQLIVLLRNFDFSIAEIKDVIENYEDREDLQYFLEEKKAIIAKKIENEKVLIKAIDQILLPIKNKEENSMGYKIEIKEFEPVNAVSIRYKGSYSDVGKYIGTIYKTVKGKADGAQFNLYYDDEIKEVADIELCVPTKGKISNVSSEEVTVKQLPRIKAICTTHVGTYETINLAYKAVMDYAKSKDIKCMLPSREIYHKGPGMIFKGNPKKYITEIVVPIEGGM
jgi:DNA-binding transcriptional MerR regulator/DNA gyrase inhibitor GyrI